MQAPVWPMPVRAGHAHGASMQSIGSGGGPGRETAESGAAPAGRPLEAQTLEVQTSRPSRVG